MPHKHNASRRHHMGKMRFKVTNWAEYETGLRRRGCLTLWVTPEALSGWAAPRRTTRGGQPRYSDLAIETTLMLGMVFGLRLRQSQGLLSSVLDLIGLNLPFPDHTTLSRRKLHLDVDTHSMTDQETGDASQLEPLLDQINDEIGQFTADGAYDATPTYDSVLRHSPGAKVVIPPRSNAVERPSTQSCCQRDDHIASMQIDGRLKWQASTGYGKRALVETAIGKYKGIIGPQLRARSFPAQQTEAAIGVAILNRMLTCRRPKSVRCEALAGAAKYPTHQRWNSA